MADETSPKLNAATAGAWISVILLIIILVITVLIWRGQGATPSDKTWSQWFASLFSGSWPNWGLKEGLKSGGISLGTILAAVVLFIPDTAVLGGFIADAANAQFRYSVTSLLGLAAALLNWISTFFFGRDGSSTQYILGNPRGAAPAAVAPPGAPPTSGTGVLGAAGDVVANVAAGAAVPLTSTIGVGSSATGSGSLLSLMPTAPTTPLTAPTTPLTAPTTGSSIPSLANRLDALRRPADTGSEASTMSDIGTTVGRGRKKQMGGARFDGNPSSILGIPLGSKAQPAGLAVLVTILTIYTIDAMSGKRYGAALGLQVAIGIATVVAYIFAYSMTEGFGSWSMLFTIFIGVAVGMIYFALPAKYHPLDPEGSVNPSGEYSKCAAGVGGVGPNGGELVCDAYLNGERIGTVPA